MKGVVLKYDMTHVLIGHNRVSQSVAAIEHPPGIPLFFLSCLRRVTPHEEDNLPNASFASFSLVLSPLRMPFDKTEQICPRFKGMSTETDQDWHTIFGSF